MLAYPSQRNKERSRRSNKNEGPKEIKRLQSLPNGSLSRMKLQTDWYSNQSDNAERNVEPEDPSPCRLFCEDAADDRTDDGANRPL